MLRINCWLELGQKTGSESTTRGASGTHWRQTGQLDPWSHLMANIVFWGPYRWLLYVSSPNKSSPKTANRRGLLWQRGHRQSEAGTSYVSSRNKSSPNLDKRKKTKTTKHLGTLLCRPSTTTWGLFCVVPQLKKKKTLPPRWTSAGKGALFGNAQTRGFPSTLNQVVPPISVYLREQTNSRVYKTLNHSFFEMDKTSEIRGLIVAAQSPYESN